MILIETSGILFDLDGTLVLSPQAVEQCWQWFAEEHKLDTDQLLNYVHGVRTIDVLKKFKPELANAETCAELEKLIPGRWSHLAQPVPGVLSLIDALPRNRWAVVTSGTKPLATGWLNYLQIEPPQVFVTAEDVERGKPDPQGFLKAKHQLKIGDDFLVFEDSPAGIRAGKAAGARVVGLTTSSDASTVKNSGADYVISDLAAVSFVAYNPELGRITLSIKECETI